MVGVMAMHYSYRDKSYNLEKLSPEKRELPRKRTARRLVTGMRYGRWKPTSHVHC